jgi:hypothetical protein
MSKYQREMEIVAEEIYQHVKQEYEGRHPHVLVCALANVMATVAGYSMGLSHEAALKECAEIFQSARPPLDG